jgi:hypothetical protein
MRFAWLTASYGMLVMGCGLREAAARLTNNDQHLSYWRTSCLKYFHPER